MSLTICWVRDCALIISLLSVDSVHPRCTVARLIGLNCRGFPTLNGRRTVAEGGEEPARQSLRQALPGAKVKVFEGLGHNPFWEDPRSVADVINPFLQG